MTKEELEKKVTELEAVIVEKDDKISELEAALKEAAPAKKGGKKTKKIVGLKASVMHSGKMFLVGTPEDKIPEEVKKLHKDKIGDVEIEV